MPTVTKPIRMRKAAAVNRSIFTKTEVWKSQLASHLGISDTTARANAVERLNALLDDCGEKLRVAEAGPLRAHVIAANEPVRDLAEKLYKAIAKLDAPYRNMLPDASAFVDHLANFHDQLAITLFQMRGRSSARGGARKVEQKNAKDTALHALRAFYDLNALGDDGELRSRALNGADQATWESYDEQRCAFLVWIAPELGLKIKAKKQQRASKARNGKAA
ncbi:hypothetical protein [Rhodanobacter sp. DHB23]|uniref:hypothetical protein n=1 Tax=Rhodanobacter sp. DHB23 TaxID=2775923 RepID=UPI00177E96AD|nr:hypothetical protein [Rhodanobacter sp. DHB23]MBD8873860.1 hypothetical protein [Rhodanobacter sp. DHB23]